MATERYVDLLKQGFMKGRKAKKVKAKKPTVSCQLCQDWHEQGRHSKTVAERREIKKTVAEQNKILNAALKGR